MNQPLVSIIIPTYNRAHLIGETLDSVMAQTYTNWECIIVDDGSTDNTNEVVGEYVQKDARFKYFHRPKDKPKGPSACRNYGLEVSNGEYVNWLDSDDLLIINKFEEDIKHIESGHYDFTISQSDFFVLRGVSEKKQWNDNLWSNNPINDFIMSKIGWSVNAPLWRKKSLIKNGLFFCEDIITADDRFYHLKALESNLKPIVQNRVSNFIRIHPQRLNDYKIKSPFKLYVNYYLITHKEKLALNEDSILFLKNQFNRQFSNLLKNKKIKLSFSYLLKIRHYKFSFKEIVTLYFKFIVGIFYTMFGVGYKLL